MELDLESDFKEMYQLSHTPKQMLVNREGMIYHLGAKLDNDTLAKHIEYLRDQPRFAFDVIENFVLAKQDVNDYSKDMLLDFLRKIDYTFADNLRHAISWRLDFTERIAYGIKGDATRTYQCEFFLISQDKSRQALKRIVDTLGSLSSGWLRLDVNWTEFKSYSVFKECITGSEGVNTEEQKVRNVSKVCMKCGKSIDNQKQYVCV